jgi:hypothetical protein
LDASTDWFWEDKAMGLTICKKSILLFLLIIFCTQAEASWQGPSEVLSGGWGSADVQFGIRYEDSGDTFSRDIIVLANGDIWIPDGLVNERLKLYNSTGNLKKIIVLDKATRTFPEYWFIGKLAAVGSDGTVYMSHYMGGNQYALYSPTGQLIKTSMTRPLELGVVSERPISESQYKITIKYPDRTYAFTTDKSFGQYIRDNTGHINAIDIGSISRFSQCGKKVGDLNIPNSGTETVTVPNIKLPVVTEVEYGQPVAAPNGDVYTWKKTSFKYSILKWTWVDDPNAPTGPDAPMGLSLMPSTSGLYLTWTASAQDPGCVTGYEVSRATSAGGAGSTVATVDKGVVKYNDTTAEAGTTYYYKVRAVSGSEYSAYTSEVSGKR